MTKRRAEEPLLLLHDLPSKRLPRSPLSVALQLDAAPPALLAVLGSRCRKRPHCSEEPEQEQAAEEPGVCGRKHKAGVVTAHAPGSDQQHHGCGSRANNRKRPREEEREPSPPGAPGEVAGTDTNTEDCAYNSFQFWRPPLPELDLSLLEDYDSHAQTEQRSKVKDQSSDAMET